MEINYEPDKYGYELKIKQEFDQDLCSDNAMLQWANQDDVKKEIVGNVQTKQEYDSHFVDKNEVEDESDGGKPSSTPPKADQAQTKVRSARNGSYAELLGNKCLYECLWCNGDFEAETWEQLSFHRLREHRDALPKSFMRGRRSDFDPYAKRLVLHRCKICGVVMPHDKGLIARHIACRHKHGESLADAVRRYSNLPPFDFDNPREKVDRKCVVLLKASSYVQHVKDKNLRRQVPVVSPPLVLKGKASIFSPKEFWLAGEKATFEIGNLCTFQCQVCLESFDTITQYHCHVSRCKEKTISVQKSLKEARYHKCRLCLTLILCDVRVIRQHVAQAHGMRLQQYAFMKPERDIKDFTKLEESIPPLSKQFQIKRRKIPLSMYSSIPQECITQEIANLCEFKCDQCDMLKSSWKSMTNHSKVCKNANGQFTHEKLVTARIHECRVCKGLLLCDLFTMTEHLRVSHKMSLEDYQQLSRSTNTIKSIAAAQVKYEQKSTSSKSELLPEWINPAGSLPDHKTTTDISNQCLFACRHCSFQTKMRDAMVHHFNRFGHGEPTKSELMACLVEFKYHCCAICARIIICLPKLINLHVQRSHRLSKQEYLLLLERQTLERLQGDIQAKHCDAYWPRVRIDKIDPGASLKFLH